MSPILPPSSLVANASVWHTLVRLLLEAGLSVSALDHNDYSALHLGMGNSRVCPPRPVQPSSFATAVDPYAEAHPHVHDSLPLEPGYVFVPTRLFFLPDPFRWLSLPYCDVLASAGGHTDVVRLLLQAGAASDSSTERDHRPLHLAAQYGHSPVIHVRWL